MLRPLPPFRAKPARRVLTPKLPSESRKDTEEVSVRARRLPVRFARLGTAPPLKVLGRHDA